METVTIKSPRDPFGEVPLYEMALDRFTPDIDPFEAEPAQSISAKDLAVKHTLSSTDLIKRAVYGYACGESTVQVLKLTELALSDVAHAFSLRQALVEKLPSTFAPFHLSTIPVVLNTFAFFAITACMAPSQNTLDQFFSLVTPGKEPEELFDRLARVFAPERPLAVRYPKMQCLPDWTKPVRAALARPAEARAAALGVCMKNWPATMRPFGLKTKPKEWHDLFPYFAFEIALAVCAYDIDDSGFRDHPFYPRELVDHYRTHIRNTRDAARPIGIDPGMPEVVTVRKPRVDLAKSKRKGLARWLELVTSGDGDAVEAVIAQVGKPRKVGDIWELLAALTDEVQYALQADVKDDESLAAQAEALAARLGFGEFAPPEDPPAGAARVEEVLRTFDGWLGQRGHQLVAINNDDDAVHAVAVRQAWLQELLDLSGALGIRAKVSAPPFI